MKVLDIWMLRTKYRIIGQLIGSLNQNIPLLLSKLEATLLWRKSKFSLLKKLRVSQI
jgi:hypothetical protein